jgi:NitT/TauT family transport system permease protein
VLLLLLIRVGGGMGIAAMALMLLGTQWYILFNVIAGAMAIPTDLKEACFIFKVRGIARWRTLILPGIFPYLVTGLVTASGGAWNASIVAEYFHFKGHIYTTPGLGATISQATDNGNFDLLLAATMMMAAAVVTINRLVWRRLYALAETRFRLET